MEDVFMKNYVVALGNLYGTKDMYHTAPEGDKVDVVIKAVLREMLHSAK